MCDYSLHAQPNRLATEGEQLIVYRFSGGSIGLTAPCRSNSPVATRQQETRRPWWSWGAVKAWFEAQKVEVARIPAVCVPPGARLLIRDMPKDLQQGFDIGETEEVTFVQLSANEYTYRDAVCFQNGRELLLQRLHAGQRVDVLSLSSEEPEVEMEHSEMRVYRER
jgi:hypothetical protein